MKTLPVVKNLFAKPAMQGWLASQLASRDDLQIFEAVYGFDDDGEKVWDARNPSTYIRECGYYAMLGIRPGVWAFLPSFLGKSFRVNGDWYTVVYKEHSADRYDGGYFLMELPNGDEAETIAESFGF